MGTNPWKQSQLQQQKAREMERRKPFRPAAVVPRYWNPERGAFVPQ